MSGGGRGKLRLLGPPQRSNDDRTRKAERNRNRQQLHHRCDQRLSHRSRLTRRATRLRGQAAFRLTWLFSISESTAPRQQLSGQGVFLRSSAESEDRVPSESAWSKRRAFDRPRDRGATSVGARRLRPPWTPLTARRPHLLAGPFSVPSRSPARAPRSAVLAQGTTKSGGSRRGGSLRAGRRSSSGSPRQPRRSFRVTRSGDALDYLALVADVRPEKLEPDAIRWHGRFERESAVLQLAESQLALAAVAACRTGDREVMALLRALLRQAQPTLMPRSGG